VSSFARICAALLISVTQFLILSFFGGILAAVLIPFNNSFVWSAALFILIYVQCVVFLLAYYCKSPIVGIGAAFAVFAVQILFAPSFLWFLCTIVAVPLALIYPRRHIHGKMKLAKGTLITIIFFLLSPYILYLSLQALNVLINTPHARMPEVLSTMGEILRTGVHWLP
jgi:hypothetical protein